MGTAQLLPSRLSKDSRRVRSCQPAPPPDPGTVLSRRTLDGTPRPDGIGALDDRVAGIRGRGGGEEIPGLLALKGRSGGAHPRFRVGALRQSGACRCRRHGEGGKHNPYAHGRDLSRWLHSMEECHRNESNQEQKCALALPTQADSRAFSPWTNRDRARGEAPDRATRRFGIRGASGPLGAASPHGARPHGSPEPRPGRCRA